MKLQSHKELIVWQRSIELVSEIYQLTDQLPVSENYNLISQMRRAATSIPSNIAEGYKRKHRAEYLYFLSIARASGAELATQVIICQDLYAVGNRRADALLDEVQRMLYRLIEQLTPVK